MQTVKLKRLGKIVAEIPFDMFPIDVEMWAVDKDGIPKLRPFTLKVNYWSNPETYEKNKEKPKGMILS